MFVWALTPKWVLLAEVLALMNQKMCPYLCEITLASVTVFAMSSGTNQWLLSWWPRESFDYIFFFIIELFLWTFNTFTIKGRAQCFSCRCETAASLCWKSNKLRPCTYTCFDWTMIAPLLPHRGYEVGHRYWHGLLSYLFLSKQFVIASRVLPFLSVTICRAVASESDKTCHSASLSLSLWQAAGHLWVGSTFIRYGSS